jgi:23S rRNA (uracil1939-C5)-methyltransferase
MDVKIEKLVYGGEGLGHCEGHTVFVPFVLPEEVVAVLPVERKKKFIRGRVEQVLSPSPRRTPARCPHFAVCGGCHYQHIPYEAQVEYKVEILRETLRRIGRIEWNGPIQTHVSPPFGYRNRAQWEVRRAGEGSAAAIGYHQAASSTICDVTECSILSPRLANALATLRDLLAPGDKLSTLTEVEAFVDSADEKILFNVSLEQFDQPPAALAETLRSAVPGCETILLHERRNDRMELSGPGFIHYHVGGTRYRVGHLSFFQVNRFLVEELALAVVGTARGRLALDLYAGVGLFTVPLARQSERVVAVEANPAAARDLQANIEQNRVPAEAVNAEVSNFLAHTRETPELVVLDPPRSGVARQPLTKLTEMAPARIVYLSCDPSTLARDLSVLMGGANGSAAYEIGQIHLFDLFPQTYHIEPFVVLERRG